MLASLASVHIRRRGLTLSPKNSTNWDTIVHALGHTINTRPMRNSNTPEKVAALKRVAGKRMAERTDKSQRLRDTEHCRKTLEYFVRCESGAVLRIAAATPYQHGFERHQEQQKKQYRSTRTGVPRISGLGTGPCPEDSFNLGSHSATPSTTISVQRYLQFRWWLLLRVEKQIYFLEVYP